MTKKQIPNPDGPKLKIGDKVKITEGEFIGFIGEVVGFVNGFKNWVKFVKIAREDGKVTILEVKYLTIELFKIVQEVVKSGIFKRIAAWFKKVFGRKNKKKNKDK